MTHFKKIARRPGGYAPEGKETSRTRSRKGTLGWPWIHKNKYQLAAIVLQRSQSPGCTRFDFARRYLVALALTLSLTRALLRAAKTHVSVTWLHLLGELT